MRGHGSWPTRLHVLISVGERMNWAAVLGSSDAGYVPGGGGKERAELAGGALH